MSIKFVAEVNWPEIDRPCYIAELTNGELGYTFELLDAKTFDTREVAERVAVSWAPNLEPYVQAQPVAA